MIGRFTARVFFACVIAMTSTLPAEVPLEGFIPFMGMGLTDEFESGSTGSATFFISQPSSSPGGSPLGDGSSAYYDLALLDTGAATHILTAEAYAGFDILDEGFDGTNPQIVGGATGQVVMTINDPLGVYVAGVSNRTGAGTALTMDPNSLRGQTSFSMLSAPSQGWDLPNIIGLPMAAHHQIVIHNDDPQIFQHQGRTVRTPEIELRDLGDTDHGTLRRVQMNLRPAASFVQGPLYVQSLDFTNPNFEFHENPQSPSVVQSGGLYLDVDVSRDGAEIIDKEFLFDTGASLTVVSEQNAARLGFDALLDTPDFVVQVEGSGGVQDGIPGFYAEELTLDTVGGSFVLNNVPIAVLNLTNPSDPGNTLDGIIGTNLFVGRNMVIDASPSIGQGGIGPTLFIGDSEVVSRAWGTTNATGSWNTAASWAPNGVPTEMWDAVVANVRGSDQVARLNSSSTVYRATVSGSTNAKMTVSVGDGAKLTTFADLDIRQGGRIHLDGGSLDAQFIVNHGELTGSGDIFVGNYIIESAVRNLSGTIAPGDAGGDPIGTIDITGDLVNDVEATLSIDLGGIVAGVSHDLITADRLAYLGGTLEANLVDAYVPQVGDTFTFITAVAGISGVFDTLDLPSGFTWDINYLANSVQLQIIGMSNLLEGDFDGDGLVSAGDLNLVLNNWGESGTPSGWVNDFPDGVISAGELNSVLSNWGNSLLVVPEPAATLTFLLGLFGLTIVRRRS